MAGFCLLIGVFLVTFDYGHTGNDIRDTGSTKQQILELSKMMAKLESVVEEIQNDNRKLKGVISELSNRLENEIRLRGQLEERVRRCEICLNEDDENDVIMHQTSLNTTTTRKRISGIRTPNGTIAFSAYMTHNLSNLGNLRILVFDAIFINEGNGYNHYVGVFTAPRTGLYVFTWTIRTYDGYYNTQLLVDGLMDGSIYTASNFITDSSSATAVVRVVAGQSVYIRTGPANNGGAIYSGNAGFSSFSGWTID